MIRLTRLLASVTLVCAGTLLTACSAAGVETVPLPPLGKGLNSEPTPGPDEEPLTPPTAAPSGLIQPPDPTATSDSVPGLTAAIARTAHPSLAVCGAHLASTLLAQGNLRGTGVTQYLVDTTCQGATNSSPDEVALYAKASGVLRRSLLIYAYTVNRPRITAFPFLAGPQTLVLQYNDGAQFRLVGLNATGLVEGPLENAVQ